MSGGEEDSSKFGLFLGCWDSEITFIRDLEQTVISVERKCKKLFEELIFYKKYLEVSDRPDLQVITNKKKTRNSKKTHLVSGSEPDIAFRKNLINSREMQQVFEEKFQTKLYVINKELQKAAHKMGLKDKIILLGTRDCPKLSNPLIEDEAENYWADVTEKYVKTHLLNAKAKSDPTILDNAEKVEFSRITKNELELYQKLSRLRLKGRTKKKLRERKLKFCYNRKTFSHRRNSSAKTESKKSKCPNKIKEKKKRWMLHRRKRNRSQQDFFSTDESREKLNEPKSLGKWPNSCQNFEQERNRTFGAAIKKTVPFTTCASTSRNFDLGLSMQQLLSLLKHGMKVNSRTFASGKASRGGKNQNYKLEDDTSPKKIEEDMERGHALSWFPSNCKTGGNETDRMIYEEHKKSPNFRKVRSRYTGNSPEGLSKYHKSCTSQLTGGQKSMIKSESKTAYAVGSKIMLSGCKRTVLQIHRNDNCFVNASGDGGYNKRGSELNTEWTDVYGSFLNILRKYSSLKEKLAGSDVTLADREIKSLEFHISSGPILRPTPAISIPRLAKSTVP